MNIMFAKLEVDLFNVAFFCFALAVQGCSSTGAFVGTRGIQFAVEGKPFYPNGFNAYWLMSKASEEAEKTEVTAALRQASRLGLNVVRTWAFSDGGYNPLQYSPGSYDEAMFKGLDFVIAEANRYGIYVILSLVNNNEEFGGRKQYVEWARKRDEEGQDQQHLSSDDDFYTNHAVKGFYRNHVKTVLTRKNTITGIAYKDEPTILAWELMNEPRCMSDLSGKTLQAWIAEMGAYVKSIDNNHLVEVGLEGFYGESMEFNPENSMSVVVGSDFIENNRVPEIDFATIHAYPDQWIPESNAEAQLAFLISWITTHTRDAAEVLHMPLLIAEFGSKYSSSRSRSRSRMTSARSWQRDALYSTVYDIAYASAKSGGACTGGLFWQLLLGNGAMDELRDGYEIIVSESPSTTRIIAQYSRNLWSLNESSTQHQLSYIQSI